MLKKNIGKSQRNLNCAISQKRLNLASVITEAKQALNNQKNNLNKMQSTHRFLGRLSKIPNLQPIRKWEQAQIKENKHPVKDRSTQAKINDRSSFKKTKKFIQEQKLIQIQNKTDDKQIQDYQSRLIQELCQKDGSQTDYKKQRVNDRMLLEQIQLQLNSGVKISMKRIDSQKD